MDREDDPTFLFVQVPEGKVAKNRIHLDVMAPDVDAEAARLVELGATRVADMEEYGYTWTVMTDPEGNEFCVARRRRRSRSGYPSSLASASPSPA